MTLLMAISATVAITALTTIAANDIACRRSRQPDSESVATLLQYREES